MLAATRVTSGFSCNQSLISNRSCFTRSGLDCEGNQYSTINWL